PTCGSAIRQRPPSLRPRESSVAANAAGRPVRAASDARASLRCPARSKKTVVVSSYVSAASQRRQRSTEMDIYTALHNDHVHVRQLLEKLVEATEINDDTSHLLTRIGDLLIPHARAEEEIFYNSIRPVDPGHDEAMHGFRAS